MGQGSGAVVITRCDRAVGCRWRDIRLIRRTTLRPPGGHRCQAEQGYLRVPHLADTAGRSLTCRIADVTGASSCIGWYISWSLEGHGPVSLFAPSLRLPGTMHLMQLRAFRR
jgi:hypothetical protein